jgi:hypothetical protein
MPAVAPLRVDATAVSFEAQVGSLEDLRDIGTGKFDAGGPVLTNSIIFGILNRLR